MSAVKQQGRCLQRQPTVDASELQALLAAVAGTQVPAEWFSQGDLLFNLAREHLKSFQAVMGGRRCPVPPREITIASACTGSASEVWAAHFLEQAARSIFTCTPTVKFKFKHLFGCDNETPQQKWISGVFKAEEHARSNWSFPPIPEGMLEVESETSSAPPPPTTRP